MKAIEFLEEWDKTHTSQPSYQDVIDWAIKKQKEIDDAKLHERFEKVLNCQKWDLIDEACKWLSDYFVIKHEAMSAQGCDAFLHEFRKAMEE